MNPNDPNEESAVKRTEISELGEFGLIPHLVENFQLRQSSSLKGIGDDAAVIDLGNQVLLVSTDMLVEWTHFDLIYTPLKQLGYKSVVVNLSDIYAMNGHPQQITVSIAVSNRYSVEALEELYEGIRLACEYYKVDLVGGDTTSSPKGLVISVTVIGRQEKTKVSYRSGATPGDQIFTTGELGGAYLGLQILEREKQLFLSDPNIKPDLENQDYLIGRFLKPEARKDAILWLDKAGVIPTAMIDLSDGLSSDLMQICKQSTCGAVIFEDAIPMHPEAQLLALKFNIDPITCALNGGEDYELLLTVKSEDTDKLKFLPGFYHIGEITESKSGIKLLSTSNKLHDLIAQGWKHFE
ncbi:MAG: thiamine-phosphate kinase [Bacteroidota bacterium]|nr:thiamine-phosphate kinase [Bacteroidota bacterium]